MKSIRRHPVGGRYRTNYLLLRSNSRDRHMHHLQLERSLSWLGPLRACTLRSCFSSVVDGPNHTNAHVYSVYDICISVVERTKYLEVPAYYSTTHQRHSA